MTGQQLQSGFLKLAKIIYSQEVTKERRLKFKKMLKTSPNFGRKAKLNEEVKRNVA